MRGDNPVINRRNSNSTDIRVDGMRYLKQIIESAPDPLRGQVRFCLHRCTFVCKALFRSALWLRLKCDSIGGGTDDIRCLDVP